MEGHGNDVRRVRQPALARPRTLTRRGVVAGALGVAGTSAIGASLARPGGGFADLASLAAAQEGELLCEPVVWASENGFLSRELVATDDLARGLGALAYEGGGTVCEGVALGFSGLVPGPTFRLYPGDRFKLKLVNRLGGDLMFAAQTTNVHVHGLHVSPLGNSDNVFVHVMSGEAFDFEFQIPDNHPTGLFWYHPHYHGQAKMQVDAGLAGAILIEEPPNEPRGVTENLRTLGARYPGPRAARKRLLVLQNLHPTDTTDTLLVNGQVRPRIPIRLGEEQRWQILNASAGHFFNVSVDGHMLQRIASDGNWIPDYGELPPQRVLPLGPAERAEVLIAGTTSDSAPEYRIRSLRKRVDGGAGGITPVFDADLVSQPENVDFTDVIATLVIEEGAEDFAEAPAPLPRVVNALSRALVPARPDRLIEFSGIPPFTIDKKRFREGRIDQTVELDATERWRIENTHSADMGWHPFHLHVNDFDVLETSVSPDDLQPSFYQDTVPLPPGEIGTPGWVELSTTFADFTGKFVYHCHILDHEDKGMMGVVEVVQPVRISGSAFSPRTVNIPQGATVLWTNLDAVSYTIAADDGSFNGGCLGPRQSFAYTFDVPGTITVRRVDGDCDGPTPDTEDMTGSVIVEAVRTVDITSSPAAPGMMAFHPASLTSPPISAGTTVVWTNRDDVAHTVSADGIFASPAISPGETFSHTFGAAGSIAYHGDVDAILPPVIVVKEVKPGAIVVITDEGLEPRDLFIAPGTRVTWTNRSGATRTVKANDGTLDSQGLEPERPRDPDAPGEPLLPAQRYSHVFDAPRTVAYQSVKLPPTTPAAAVFTGIVHVVTEVEIVDFAFQPMMVDIPAGTAVSWINRGPSPHIVAHDGGTFTSAVLAVGDRFTQSFASSGVVSYHCAIHPAMKGAVVVP